MLRFTAYLAIFTLISFQVHARGYYNSGYNNNDQGSPQHNPQYGQSSPRRHEPQAWDQSVVRYFKASMGSSSLKDHEDSSGKISFESTSVLPINLAYGATIGNAMFEIELGFSNNDHNFISAFDPEDDFSGNILSTRLMINGMYKTSMTGSNLYVGGGLGTVSVSLDGPDDELTGSAIGAQFIFGGELRASDRSGIFIEFKSLSTIGLEVENDFAEIDYNFKESSLNMGFKLYF